ncbi:MAG: hypothetical protein AAGF92_01380 [Myxococcota bacterium]
MCGASLLMLGVTACGDDGTQVEPTRIKKFSAGDTDPFGCPFVDPVPWVDEATHQDTCGEGCTPEGQSGDFIACLSPDVPRIDSNTVAPVVVTLCHPVSGASYGFGVNRASPFTYVCFGLCDEDGAIASAETPEPCLATPSD